MLPGTAGVRPGRLRKKASAVFSRFPQNPAKLSKLKVIISKCFSKTNPPGKPPDKSSE
jgi:hypothetical protein